MRSHKLVLLFLSLFVFAFLFGYSYAQALEQQVSVNDLIRAEIAQQFPRTQIALSEKLVCQNQELLKTGTSVAWVGESTVGVAKISIKNEKLGTSTECTVPFEAQANVRIANRRIYPGERLIANSFQTRGINVAIGEARNLRGVILPADMDIVGLETRQTILEGQMLLSTSVQRVPDIRRGESVKVLFSSNDVVLSTAGMTEEAGFYNDIIHVMTQKSKKQFTGKLLQGGVVEVKL